MLAVGSSGCGPQGAVVQKSGDTSGPERAAEPSPLIDEASAGVSSPELAALLREHWEIWVARAPTWATTLGDHRYDDRLGDRSRAAIERQRREDRELLGKARAIDASKLDERDATTLALFIERGESDIASEVCETGMWNVSPFGGNPIAGLNRLPTMHRLASADDVANLLARYRAMPKAIDDTIANLERGAAAGMFGNAESIRRTLELADRQLAKPVEKWPLLEPLGKIRELSGADAARLEGEFRQIVAGPIAASFRRYRDFVAQRIQPNGRSGERVGVHALPNGRACYAARIQHYLGLPRTAEELHQLGLSEIQRINGEMRQLGNKLFGTEDLGEILTRLRTDKALYFESAEEMLREANRALERANAAMPGAFGIQPKAKCVVTPIPDYEAPFTTIAYYRQPHYDGSKPGEYFVNTYKPETRPRYEFQALSFHEAVPGHHLQIAIAQELPALPTIRKLRGSTAFIEGWALYTERLSDELGLYDGDLDRMGMLSYEAWRASRLVVDTGLHALGWTRRQAEEYMEKHTALAVNNIANEVDRYISRPGQALAYKVGQLEILRLREWAKEQLGARFSLAGFHDTVLGRGGVTLAVLQRQVRDWVAAEKRAAGASAP